MKLFEQKQKSRTVFQIKQKMLEQLNLTLNWSKQSINSNYHSLSSDDVEELRRIRFTLKGLMKDIDNGEFEVKQ